MVLLVDVKYSELPTNLDVIKFVTWCKFVYIFCCISDFPYSFGSCGFVLDLDKSRSESLFGKLCVICKHAVLCYKSF